LYFSAAFLEWFPKNSLRHFSRSSVNSFLKSGNAALESDVITGEKNPKNWN